MCFQETKMERINVGIVQSLWGGSFTGWAVVPASSGILLMWDKCVMECIEVIVGTFSIFCKFKSVFNQFVLAFSGIYGPNADSDRHYLWEELSELFNW